MPAYSEKNYSIEEALKNIGDYFWKKYRADLRAIAETNDAALIKRIHDSWDSQTGCSSFGTDIRIEWAKAVYAHGDWEKAVKMGVPDFKDDTSQAVSTDPRLRYPAEYRCDNGIYVRSLPELCIANWLYFNGVRFEYEREVFFESTRQKAHCDFYLVKQKIYVEYWGTTDQEDYKQYKGWKQKLYSQNGLPLIELNHNDLKNLRDILNKKIRSIKNAD